SIHTSLARRGHHLRRAVAGHPVVRALLRRRRGALVVQGGEHLVALAEQAQRAGVLGCADRRLALNAGQLHLYGERDQVHAALNNKRAASASQQRAEYRVAGYGAPQV
ncbi:hypothetical protein ACV33X_34795, partial [Pseudomonas aeruginosa]